MSHPPVLAFPDADGSPLFLQQAASLSARRGAALVVVAEEGFAGAEAARDCAARVLLHPQAGSAARAGVAIGLDYALVLTPDTPTGRDIARRIGAVRGWEVATGVQFLDQQTPVAVDDRAIWETPMPEARIWCLAESFQTEEHPATQPDVPGCDVDDVALPQTREVLRESFTVSAADLSLTDAPFVISAGDGIRDFALFQRFCTALGAAQGASRVVCDKGLMPRSRQVGSSGWITRARCYVALGISGAVQHLDGISDCEHVFAVNPDTSAPIHERAALGLACDAEALMRAALSLLEGERE